MNGIAGLNGFVGFPEKNIYISPPKTLARAGINYINKDSRGVIWAAQYNGELWISTNDGVDFTKNCDIFESPQSELLGHYKDSGHYCVGIDSLDRLYTVNKITGIILRGVINKADNVVTWTAIDHTLVLDSHDPIDIFFDIYDNMYITCTDGRIYKSLDYGATINNGLQVTSAWYKGQSNSIGELFIISKTQLWKSKDSGANWEVIYNFSSLFINNFCFDDNDTLFVVEFIDNSLVPGVFAKLYSSYDGGYSFDTGTEITRTVNNRFYGIVAIDINRVVITTATTSGYAFSFNADYSDILNLKIVDKMLDNAELICSMNKGNDSFLPTVALSPSRYAETQTSLSVLRKDITIELEKDGFNEITVSFDKNGEILIDCKHD